MNSNGTIYTKTMTPMEWWDFQKQDAVVDVLDIETAVKLPNYKEQRYTFVWDASKNHKNKQG